LRSTRTQANTSGISKVFTHDLWDSDQPAAPTLIDIKTERKDNSCTRFDQQDGVDVSFSIEPQGVRYSVCEERPVPKGDAPENGTHHTTFPREASGFGANVLSKKEDIVTAEDTSPEHAKACMEAYERAGGYYNAGPFTPFLFHEEGTPPKSTIQFPGNGGTNWGGPAGDPELGYIFAFTQDAALAGWIERRDPEGTTDRQRSHHNPTIVEA
jgi:quinoprotein glucose dehydrogenase